jgi:NADP-dependent 3-hydroxy acid dehydrogenase YdfG
VTGVASGIGTETARALASAGAEVVMAARRLQSAGQVPAGIIRSTNNSSVSVRAPDLSDQGSGDFAAALDHRRKEEKRNHVHHHRR